MLCNTKTGTQGTRCKYAAPSVENFQFLSIRQISIKSVDFDNNCSQKRYKSTEIRSKNVFDLENLCTIMEERMVNNVYNDIFDNTKQKMDNGMINYTSSMRFNHIYLTTRVNKVPFKPILFYERANTN